MWCPCSGPSSCAAACLDKNTEESNVCGVKAEFGEPIY